MRVFSSCWYELPSRAVLSVLQMMGLLLVMDVITGLALSQLFVFSGDLLSVFVGLGLFLGDRMTTWSLPF